tara:strand:- start:438 stop:854 length:417 start_codon:yes stop_codon:yes gene_type:complete
MSKYYIENININNILERKKQFNLYYETLILTENGFIKVVKDKYVNYILKKNMDIEVIENFLDNSDLFIDKSSFIKDKIINCIPINHKKINLEFHNYKIGKIKFVIEYIDKRIKDYYFISETNLDIDNIQKEIVRFLKQ